MSFKSEIKSVTYHNRGGYEYNYEGGSFFGASFYEARTRYLEKGDSVFKSPKSFQLQVITKRGNKKTIYKSEDSHYFFTEWIGNL
jgi:hypothetical protein